MLESHVLLLLLSCAFTMESCIAIGCSFHCSLALLRYSLYGFLFLLSLPFSRLEPKFNSLFYYYHTRFLSCTLIWISFECILLSLFDSIHPSIHLSLFRFGRFDTTCIALPVCSELKLLFPFYFERNKEWLLTAAKSKNNKKTFPHGPVSERCKANAQRNLWTTLSTNE